jgi:hypothetical protein
MPFKSCAKLVFAVLVLGLLFGCSGASTSSGANSNAVITLIANGVHAAGTAMHTSALNNKTMTSVCDEHGYPTVNQSDTNYPGYLAHCFMSIDSGDTVLGGFDIAKGMACLMESAGVVYDGVTRTITVDPTVAAACGLPSKSGSLSALVTASSPASFNSNYSHGVILDVSDTIGGTFKIASNVDGTTSSFLTSESWTDGSIGTTAGKMDTATGDLWYESRVERNNCTTESRCGWNRHTRIKASIILTDDVPTGLNSMSFGYSNIQFTPGQNGFGGTVVDADGDMTTGIKARLWQATHDGGQNQPTDATDYDVVGNWVEVTNTACYTSTSETASTCGDGLDLFSTNTKFLLNATDSHVSVEDWLNTITGQTFTSVHMDDDTQF